MVYAFDASNPCCLPMKTMTSREHKKCTQTQFIIVIIFFRGILICSQPVLLVYTQRRVRLETGPGASGSTKTVHCVQRRPQWHETQLFARAPEKMVVPGPEKMVVPGPEKMVVPGPEKMVVPGSEKMVAPAPEKLAAQARYDAAPHSHHLALLTREGHVSTTGA